MTPIFQPFHVIKSKCSEVNLAPLILREGYPKPQLPNNPIEHGQTSVIRAQCYKTFYIRNLQIFSISWSVCLWQIYQPYFNVCWQGQELTQVKHLSGTLI
jgi:hypothetical protein